jgi:DNA-binding NtrC family response regulator
MSVSQAEPVNVLFVDDDPVTGEVMQRRCASAGYNVDVYQSPKQCLQAFATEGADIVITDLRMPEMNGFELLTEIRKIDGDVPVLVMTGYSSLENAVEAMRHGADDFIKKPFDFEEMKLIMERVLRSHKLKNENRLLKRQIESAEPNRFNMIGDSPAMRMLYNTIEKVAQVSCNVIIAGESGTGKELVAQALHHFSPRKDEPFVVIDCGALTETLLESELFGHEKGAFTGAGQRKHGLMEQASGGTLFLDEISNISDTMQMKLMRAIEDQKVTRVGGTASIPIDLRIVVATNRNLEAMVEEGSFRHDFYHRLNVVNIQVPTLEQRREDIPALVEHFTREFAQRYNREVTGFDAASLERLCRAPWPGNIRQLRNTVERCVILAEGNELRYPSDGDNAVAGEDDDKLVAFPDKDFVPLAEIEQAYISHVLRHTGGKKTKAARILGIDKTTLWRKLKRFDHVSAND